MRVQTKAIILLIFFFSVFQVQNTFAKSQDKHHDNRQDSAPTDQDYYNDSNPAAEKVELGRNLFFDKILSGNANIACASCHHALTDTGDGMSLPIGEGALGLGMTRDTGTGDDAVHERVPRNAPPVFNLGAREFTTMFHDGRLAVDATQPSGFLNPAGDNLPDGLDSVLAAQAMFPVTSGTEMAGQPGENTIADAAAAGNLAGPDGVWEQLAKRLREIPGYIELFTAAYADIDGPEDITYVHAANAIAAFEAVAWRADNSPYDRYLRGDRKAMSRNAIDGMRVFNRRAGCSNCHSGKFQTDHQFYAIAVPHVGPGKGDGATGHEDFGRERVSGNLTDRYKFRVPTLRNVALTGPWGHNGAFGTLEGMVRHHLDPVNSFSNYDQEQVSLPSRDDLDALDFMAHNDAGSRAAVARACELGYIELRDKDIEALVDFLHALTDPASQDLRHDIPKRVPSGLPVFD